ncbi:MAG: carbon-nitrogen hydrolase family protein, partial [Defluviitaleaceae bacterium]|nr:carbon-nitrogen hydrolase family protein [Defluviitaleaceae bacterium]
MSKNFVVALAQFKSILNDINSNLKRGLEICVQAKKRGADLVLFPELWSIGASGFPDWGTDAQKQEWLSQAANEKSEFIQEFIKIAAELKLAVAVSYLEKYEPRPRNTVSVIDSTGRIILTYAKVHTCDFSADERSLTDGDTFKVCALHYEGGTVKLGAMICYDREHPESARVLMLKGAEIILVPNACAMTDFRLKQFSTRAFENMTGVAMANYAAGRCWGRSAAYSPVIWDADRKEYWDVPELAQGGFDEQLLIANFPMDEIREYRETAFWGNAYRKPSAYTELVSYETEALFVRKTD